MKRLRWELLAAMGIVVSSPVACGARTGLGVPHEVGLDDSGLDARESGITMDASLLDAADATDVGVDAAVVDSGITVRRPFLVGASMRTGKVIRRSDWTRDIAPIGDIDERTRHMLARAWADDGRDEHASIAAFARFTMLLLSVGAPPDLVIASQRASLDEVRHARDCFALASRYGDGAVGPSRFDVHDSLGMRSLREVAALAAEEGCVGETLGVALVREALSHATDPDVALILDGVARDETRHAALAWRFVRWAIDEGGEPVREAVVRAIHHACAVTRQTPIRDYGVDGAVWRAHGRLTCQEARATSERAICDVVLPCMQALESHHIAAAVQTT